MKPITKLVLSGGGTKGLCMLGALHYIYENNIEKDIEEIWGVSIGSIIGLCLAIGYRPIEIFQYMYRRDSFMERLTGDFYEMIEKKGIYSIKEFGNQVFNLIHKKIGYIPTFRDIYNEYGIQLFIIGTNVNKVSGEIFNVYRTPEMNVIDAIEISCNIPFLFSKKFYNGDMYVDGGFFNIYPIDLANNHNYENDYIIGIDIHDSTLDAMDKSIVKHISWIIKLLYVSMKTNYELRKYNKNENVIDIKLNVENISMLQMNPSKKEKMKYFIIGYKDMREKANKDEVLRYKIKNTYLEKVE